LALLEALIVSLIHHVGLVNLLEAKDLFGKSV